MSMARFPPSSLTSLGSLALSLLSSLGLVHVRREQGEGQQELIECNNLTLINFTLKLLGPMHERTLTTVMLLFQVDNLLLLIVRLLYHTVTTLYLAVTILYHTVTILYPY